MVLNKDVRSRTTFTGVDSSHHDSRFVGTLDDFEHILEHQKGYDLEEIVKVAKGEKVHGKGPNRISNYLEAQIHGPVEFSKDVEKIVAPTRYEKLPEGEKLRLFAAKNGVPLYWNDGKALIPDVSQGAPLLPSAKRRVKSGLGESLEKWNKVLRKRKISGKRKLQKVESLSAAKVVPARTKILLRNNFEKYPGGDDYLASLHNPAKTRQAVEEVLSPKNRRFWTQAVRSLNVKSPVSAISVDFIGAGSFKQAFGVNLKTESGGHKFVLKVAHSPARETAQEFEDLKALQGYEIVPELYTDEPAKVGGTNRLAWAQEWVEGKEVGADQLSGAMRGELEGALAKATYNPQTKTIWTFDDVEDRNIMVVNKGGKKKAIYLDVGAEMNKNVSAADAVEKMLDRNGSGRYAANFMTEFPESAKMVDAEDYVSKSFLSTLPEESGRELPLMASAKRNIPIQTSPSADGAGASGAADAAKAAKSMADMTKLSSVLGPMDFLVIGAISPVMYKASGESDIAARQMTYNALWNFSAEPAAMLKARKVLMASGKFGAKGVMLGSMLPLAPLVVAETFVEDSIEEWIRTDRLAKMGITDIAGDAISVMGRTSEGWSEFTWNSSEERAVKGGEVYNRLTDGIYAGLTSRAAAALKRELSEEESAQIFEEAIKRANRLLPDRLDDDLNRLKKLDDATELRRRAHSLLTRLNADQTFTKAYGGELVLEDVWGMVSESVREDAEYAKSPFGALFKTHTDLLYGGVRGLHQAMRPIGKELEPTTKALQGGMIAAADFLKPAGDVLAPHAVEAQKHVEGGLKVVSDALTPVQAALFEFGGFIGNGAKPLTDALAGVAGFFGKGIYDNFGFRERDEAIAKRADEKMMMIAKAMKVVAPAQPDEEATPIFASAGPSFPRTGGLDCGPGYKAVERSGGMSCEKLTTVSSPVFSSPAPGAANPGAGGQTTVVRTDSEIVPTIKVHGGCLSNKYRRIVTNYPRSGSSICVMLKTPPGKPGIFIETKNPRYPYRSLSECPNGYHTVVSHKPAQGDWTCRKAW
jgi:hypothetical protein